MMMMVTKLTSVGPLVSISFCFCTECCKLVFTNGYDSKAKKRTMWNTTPKKSAKYAILPNTNFI